MTSWILEDLKPLADLLLESGVPLLANMLLPGIGGKIANTIVPEIAQAFGLSPGASVNDMTTAIQADPNAQAKLAVIESNHKELLSFAQDSLTANQSALTLEPTFMGRFFVGGWRPAMGWIGVLTAAYQVVASVAHFVLIPVETYGITLGVWAGLAGIRGVEKVHGVARSSMKTVTAKIGKS